LTEDDKQVVDKTLKKFPTLVGGGLGMLNIKPVKLELIDGAKPYHARLFPVPHSLEAISKTNEKVNRHGQRLHLFRTKRQVMCVS
jgi:IS1 family transposase